MHDRDGGMTITEWGRFERSRLRATSGRPEVRYRLRIRSA